MLAHLTGPAAQAVTALLALSPEMARRSLSWTRSYLHALSIVLQGRGCAAPASAKALYRRNPDLFARKTRELLEEALGPVPPRFERFLDRLGLRLRGLEFYQTWAAELSADKRLAIFLTSSSTRLTETKLRGLLLLPPDLRTPRMMARVTCPDDVALAERLIRMICERCPEVRAEQVRQSLARTEADPDDWLNEWLWEAELPRAPFPARGKLHPFTSGQEMRRAGRHFKNCLGDMIDEAIAGERAFYLWQDRPSAIVALKRVGVLGWVLDEVKLSRNRKPSRAMFAEIEACLEGAGCLTRGISASVRRFGVWTFA
jgi:hypothetical protein